MDSILETLKYLSSPFEEGGAGKKFRHTTPNSPGALLSSLIDNCKFVPDQAASSIEYTPNTDSSSTWRFTCLILRVLSKLRLSIEEIESRQSEQEKSIEVLSLQSQIQVQKCIEVVIGFGVLPYLLPGVGIPSKLRHVPNSKIFTLEDEKSRDLEKFHRLAHVTKTVFELSAHPSLHQLIFPKHTTDILGALLQLCKTPLKKPDLGNPLGLSLEEYRQVEEERTKLNAFLEQILEFTPQGTLISALLLLGSAKLRWMSRSCYQIVYRIILSPEKQGLLGISQAVLESMGHSNAWKVSRVVANLLKESIRFPDFDMSSEVRISNLAAQTYKILSALQITPKSRQQLQNEHLSTIGFVCGLTLLSLDESLTKLHLFDKLFHPLLNIEKSLENNLNASITLESLSSTLFFVDQLLSTSPSLEYPMPLHSFPFWPLLFQLYVSCKSYSQKKIQDPAILEELEATLPKFTNALVHLFEVADTINNDPNLNFTTLNFCINLILNSTPSSPTKRYNFEIELCDDYEKSEVTILVQKYQHGDDLLDKLTSDCAFLSANVLKHERLKAFRGKLFTQLMSSSSENPKENPTAMKNNSVLMELDFKEKIQMEKFIRMQLLSELGNDESILEELGSLEDPLEMVRFLELIFKKLILELNSSAEANEDYEFSQSIIFCLTILTALCESKTERSKEGPKKEDNNLEWRDLKTFLPYLKQLRESFHAELISKGIPTMAEELIILIETKGTGTGKKIQVVSRFEKAMENVGSLMLPVKGHGLLELRKLIEDKDEEALKHEKVILDIFLKEVKHEDSYIYLMSIQGLATLGAKFHSIVVPVLVEQYAFENPHSEKVCKGMKAEEKSELRMKIGEALVRIVQKLGNFAAIYRVPLTNVCFSVVRDDDPLVRASALSNLGELCHLLKFTLGVVLTEVWLCVEAVLNLEKHLEVRRAALHLVVLLLRGVEKEYSVSYLLENKEIGRYLRDVRRLLSLLRDTEKDTVATIHCQLALKELDLIVSKIFRPSDKLEYKIRVLDMNN
ncbi:unnamed protein product [Allacma fusca]|uniref:Uncharacterized protein n=1 Tax=Allacma fusca TaxID=39272 RepID=A0A8J2PDH3_9HEXA|nr:unnamed protein product [Allacma fusca]